MTYRRTSLFTNQITCCSRTSARDGEKVHTSIPICHDEILYTSIYACTASMSAEANISCRSFKDKAKKCMSFHFQNWPMQEYISNIICNILGFWVPSEVGPMLGYKCFHFKKRVNQKQCKTNLFATCKVFALPSQRQATTTRKLYAQFCNWIKPFFTLVSRMAQYYRWVYGRT